jgi:hypothetical protein
MVTKVWIIIESSNIVERKFYFSPLAAELAINDACMNGIWKVLELTLAERG